MSSSTKKHRDGPGGFSLATNGVRSTNREDFFFYCNPIGLKRFARLLREKRVQGRPHRRKDAEGGPPAESECLERKSTSTKEREQSLK